MVYHNENKVYSKKRKLSCQLGDNSLHSIRKLWIDYHNTDRMFD